MSAPIVRPRRGRPPKVSRDHEDTREALLRCGMEILTAQGLTATGIESVLKRVDVPKGSFYHYFDSKDAFGLEVLQSYAEYFARKLDRWLLDDSLPPLQRLTLSSRTRKPEWPDTDLIVDALLAILGKKFGHFPRAIARNSKKHLRTGSGAYRIAYDWPLT